MKTLFITFFSLVFVCASFAQIGNKKIATKNINAVISAKPSNKSLKNVKVSKKLNLKKLPKLYVPEDKLRLPATRKVARISALKPYSSNLDISYRGSYNKNYLLLGGFAFGPFDTPPGLVTFNAQRGKQYRMKVVLAPKKQLEKDFSRDFPEGSVSISIGDLIKWHSLPVDRQTREFNIVFTAAQAGKIQIFINGIIYSDWDWGDILWLPIKSIQVDEI